MALQSAFQDPRFSPVNASELKDLEIEISVLTPMKPVSGYEDIVVGRDGVVLSKDGHSAVFLPQVAPEQGWDRDTMLDHLSMKAGLTAGSWREGAQFSTFQAIVFHEGEFKEAHCSWPVIPVRRSAARNPSCRLGRLFPASSILVGPPSILNDFRDAVVLIS